MPIASLYKAPWMLRMSNHRVEHIMGTTFSLDVQDAEVPPEAIEAAFAALRAADARFSPFKPESEVSRLLRGELSEADCERDLRQILALAEALRERTGGYFDVRQHRPDARPDPTGLVKGWTLEEAAWILTEAGIQNFCFNGGGDVVTRGRPQPDSPWKVGIRHPERPDALTAVLGLSGESIATSGAYERGAHITDPHTKLPAQGLLSISVIGPSLATADALATAVFAMGRPGLDWLAAQPDYTFVAVTAAREVVWEERASRLRLASSPIDQQVH